MVDGAHTDNDGQKPPPNKYVLGNQTQRSARPASLLDLRPSVFRSSSVGVRIPSFWFPIHQLRVRSTEESKRPSGPRVCACHVTLYVCLVMLTIRPDKNFEVRGWKHVRCGIAESGPTAYIRTKAALLGISGAALEG